MAEIFCRSEKSALDTAARTANTAERAVVHAVVWQQHLEHGTREGLSGFNQKCGHSAIR